MRAFLASRRAAEERGRDSGSEYSGEEDWREVEWAAWVKGAERCDGGSDVGGGRSESARDLIALSTGISSGIPLGAFGRADGARYDPTIARVLSTCFSSGGRSRIGGGRLEADAKAFPFAARGAALPMAFSCIDALRCACEGESSGMSERAAEQKSQIETQSKISSE